MKWICWWMTPRQISMWNVHMWPSSALDLTPVGVCNGETNPLDLCWCAISKNVHVLVVWPGCTGRKVEHSRSTSQCKDVTWCVLFGQLRVLWLSICTFSERYLVKGEGNRRRLHWINQWLAIFPSKIFMMRSLPTPVETDLWAERIFNLQSCWFAAFFHCKVPLLIHQSKAGSWTKLEPWQPQVLQMSSSYCTLAFIEHWRPSRFVDNRYMIWLI